MTSQIRKTRARRTQGAAESVEVSGAQRRKRNRRSESNPDEERTRGRQQTAPEDRNEGDEQIGPSPSSEGAQGPEIDAPKEGDTAESGATTSTDEEERVSWN